MPEQTIFSQVHWMVIRKFRHGNFTISDVHFELMADGKDLTRRQVTNALYYGMKRRFWGRAGRGTYRMG